MKTHRLNAEIRTEKGKNACSRLRRRGLIPAVVYSHGSTESIQVNKREFSKLFHGRISESVLIGLNLPKAEEPEQMVIVKDYQLDPVTDEVVHLDFYKVTSGEKIQTRVSVVTGGTSKGERMGGILEVIERELEIECLPADLPEKVEIDVTNLELGHSIHISDLPVSGSMKYLGDPGRVVVTVVIPKAVVEEVVEEVAPEAAEAAEGAEAAPAEDKDKDKVKEKEKAKEKGKPEEKSKG